MIDETQHDYLDRIKLKYFSEKTSVFRNSHFLTKYTVPKSIIRLNA